MRPGLTRPPILLLALAACIDGSAPSKPTAIEFIATSASNATAGHTAPVAPTFVVKDQNGNAMAGVPITIAVVAGGGTLTSTPTKTIVGPTSIGVWTLGTRVGTNTVSVSTTGLTAAVVTIESVPGAPAKFLAPNVNLPGVVGSLVGPGPAATLMDQNDNPIPAASISVGITGGGQAPTSITSDGLGSVAVTNWSLGTIKGMNTLTMTSGAALVTFSAVAAPGPVSSMSVVSGNAQSSMAGTPLASQVRFAVVDLFNNGVQGRVVTFSVQSGGGSISNSAATTDTDGVAVLNGWTLGRSAAPQAVRASFGNFSTTASASVQSGYDIDIRFFGPAMSSEQRAIFTNAAARIRGVVVGDIVNVLATNIDVVSACGATGVAPLNELIDDVIIYASIIPIDGPGKILGQAGPCLFRSSSSRYLTAVGRMQFDIDDIAAMAANGTLQDVIIHEMLHVLGIGQTFWSVNGLLVNLDLPTVGYVGLQGRQGCFDLGGAITCSGSVPVENTGGQGTAGAHWRESVFNAELMTGYSNVGPSPFSLITVGSLSDIGYVVNRSAADPFNPGNFSLRSQQLARPLNEGPWEKTLDIVPQVLRPDGKLEPLQKR